MASENKVIKINTIRNIYCAQENKKAVEAITYVLAVITSLGDSPCVRLLRTTLHPDTSHTFWIQGGNCSEPGNKARDRMSGRYVSPGTSAFLSTFNFSGAWSLSFESPCEGEENHSIGEDSTYVCQGQLEARKIWGKTQTLRYRSLACFGWFQHWKQVNWANDQARKNFPLCPENTNQCTTHLKQEARDLFTSASQDHRSPGFLLRL